MLTANGRVFMGGAGSSVPELVPGGGTVPGANDYKVLTYGAIVRLIAIMIEEGGGTGGGGVTSRTDAQIRALANEAIAAAGLSTDAERMTLENALRALIQTNAAAIQGNLNNLQSISTAVNTISVDLAGLSFVKDITQAGTTFTVTFRDDSTRELTAGGGGGENPADEHVAGYVRAFESYDADTLLAMSLAAKAARDAGDDGAEAVWIVGRDQETGEGVPGAKTLEDRTGGRIPAATGAERLFKAGSILQVVYVDDETFTLALISVPVEPAADLDYADLAAQLFSDSSRVLAPAQNIAFAAAGGDGEGNPAVTTTHDEDLGEGDLTEEEKTAIADGAETTYISGSVEWIPGIHSGFSPTAGTLSVLVGDAGGDDMDTLGTVSLGEGENDNFSFPVTIAAAAKGGNVRLRLSVSTKGGALPQNAFNIGQVILHEKGSAVARVFALAKSAVSGMFATLTSAIASMRDSIQTNKDAIAANAVKIAANLSAINILRAIGRPVISAAVLAWQNGLRIMHIAGTIVFHSPYDGIFSATTGATTATATKAGTLAASTIGRGPDTDYPNVLIITPLNQIHKVLVIKNTKGADQTLIFLQVMNIYGAYANLPFFQRYTAEDNKKYYRFVNIDGAQESAYTNTEIEAKDGDSLAISLTAGAHDPTAEEFVISLRRAGEETHAQNTITAPAGTLARARFNRVLIPDDRAGNYRNCEDVAIIHHEGVYVSHFVLGLIDLAGDDDFYGIATQGAGSDYLQQTKQVDYPNGLRVRGVEVVAGSTRNYRINCYVRVAHGTDVSAGITLTSGGVWDETPPRGFTTLPTTDLAGATVLGKLPADFLNSQVYDFYIFHRLFIVGESDVSGDEWDPGGKADRDNDGTAPALTPKSVVEEHLADGAVSNRTIGAGAVGLLKLAVTVLARMAPDLAGNGGKFIAANAGETGLEFVDAPSGGGGANGKPDAKMVIYSSEAGVTAASTLELSAAVALDNDWDELISTVDDSAEGANGKIELALAMMADVRLNWNPIAGLGGVRTHAYAIGDRFLEFGGSGNVGIYGRLEGTANSITHFSVGFNSGGRLFELRVVRGKTGGDARLDAAATKHSFGGRLTARLDTTGVGGNQNPLTPTRFDVDLSDVLELRCGYAGLSSARNTGELIAAQRSSKDDPFTFSTQFFLAVDNNGFRIGGILTARDVYGWKV